MEVRITKDFWHETVANGWGQVNNLDDAVISAQSFVAEV